MKEIKLIEKRREKKDAARIKKAVTVELRQGRWKRNPHWLARMMTDTVASLRGHLGALREQLLRPDGMTRRQ